MLSLEKMDWATQFSLKSFGVRVGIRISHAKLADQVRRHLPRGAEASASPAVDRVYSIIVSSKQDPRNGNGRFNLIYADDEPIAREAKLEVALERLESDLRLFVAELAPHRVFVHAGVVGWKGKAIVIPGRSYSGKTTMVAELVKAGATYYSDEYAVLDARGRVHPFPKPLEIREQGDWRQTKTSVESLGGQIGSRPLPVGLVMMTKFKAGARWSPRTMSPGKAVLALLANTVSARRHPEKALAALQHVMAAAQAISGVRGEASELTSLLLSSVEKKA